MLSRTSGQYRNEIFLYKVKIFESDVRLTVHRNSVWIRKTNWMSLFVFFISLLIVSQHVSGNHVSIIKLIHLSDVWLTVHRNSVWIKKIN